VNNAIGKGAGKGSVMEWAGSASGTGVSLVKEVAFEDGSRAKKPHTNKPHPNKGPSDKLTDNGGDGSVSWDTHTSTAWDGVVVRAVSGSTLRIVSGSASLVVSVP